MGAPLGVAFTALSIIALIAGGIAAVMYANVKGLRGDRDDLTARAARLQTERDDLERQLASERVQHKVTRSDLEAVGRVVTGEAHWVALEQQLDHHHDETVSRLDRIIAALRKGAT